MVKLHNYSDQFSTQFPLITKVLLINTTYVPLSITDDEIITNNPISSTSKSNITYPAEWHAQIWFDYAQNRLELVNSHWLKFPPPPKEAHEFLAALYILIMTAGVCGNFLVIYMFVRCKSLHTPANILVTNLAVSDLLMMIKMPLFIYNSINYGVPLEEIGCKIYGFVGGLTGTVSICTLACIALDRYYVVVYPLNRSVTTLRSKICVIIAWIYGAVFASLPIVHPMFGTYVPEGYLTSCSFDYLNSNATIKRFILCYFFAAWVIPFLIISVCYSKIIRVVMQARNIGNKMEDPSNSSRHCKEQEQKKKEIRLALVVLAIIGLWFAAWTPYAVVALLGIAGREDLITPLSSMIPALFCKTASCLDPFVYAVTNQKFKDELKSKFGRKSRNRSRSSKKVWTTHISNQPTLQYSLNSDDGVEEIIIMVDSVDKKVPKQQIEQKNPNKKSTPKKGIGCSMVQPIETTVPTPLSPELISNVGKKNRASWIIKPNFSNRTSSLRNMARTWNKSKDSANEEHASM